MTKVKVKVIKRYSDIVLQKIMEEDTEFETDERRAQHLAEQGMVKIIKASSTDKKTETTT